MSVSGTLIGRTLGDYQIAGELGRGGMGVVFLARERSLRRAVALKILAPRLAKDPAYVKRFLHEARSVACLDHPNIVAVYSAGECEGVYYLAMEYVRGRSLHRLIREQGPLEVLQALRIAGQVAAALEEAHQHGIVHRDIKPHNIMLDESGQAKVADFGLAKHTQNMGQLTVQGAVLGTPMYMSPEQCRGKGVDHRSDIYSLGVTLFEMLSGSPPHEPMGPLALMYQIVNGPLPSLRHSRGDVPEQIDRIVSQAVAKNPAHRYASAQRMRRALERCAEECALLESAGPCAVKRQTGMHTGLARLREAARLPRRVSLLAVFLILAVGVFAGLWAASRSSPEAAHSTAPGTPSASRVPPSDTAEEQTHAADAPRQGVVADSLEEYSSEQGLDGWYYGYYARQGEPGTFREMVSAHTNAGPGWRVRAEQEYPCLWDNGGHPGGGDAAWPVRRWVSEVAGAITIYGELAKVHIGEWGDGITGQIYVDGRQVWSDHVAVDDGEGIVCTVDARVSEGSTVDFVLVPGENTWEDGSRFTAMIFGTATGTEGGGTGGGDGR